MRKYLWVIPVLFLFAAIGAPNAHAQTYNAVYTCIACTYLPIPTNNPITFPISGSTFLDYTFDGIPLANQLIPLDSAGDQYSWTTFVQDPTTEIIIITDETNIIGTSGSNQFPTLAGCSGCFGSLSFTPATTVTPEPDTAVLWLTGIGLLGFVMRKRIAQGHQQAT
jgi:PEP-CTERM motif